MSEQQLTPDQIELEEIRAVFGHGADEENWEPGTTLAEAVSNLKKKSERLQSKNKSLRKALLQMYSVTDADSETKPVLKIAWEALYPNSTTNEPQK